MKKAIIFGSNSQDGYYLTKILNRENIKTISVSRTSGDFLGDIGDFDFVNKLIGEIKPDFIFHFAANSTTNHNAIMENHSTISTGTLNLLESAKKHSIESKIFLSGSALQFENIGLPINENSKFDASSSYAVSRIHSVYLARYYRKNFGMNVYVGYLFNHDSPLRKINHFNQKVILEISDILAGNNNNLDLGNLNIIKEFGFAGDIVEAIWIFVNQCKTFEVVIGTGKGYSLKDWVDKCFKKVGLDWKKYVTHNEDNKVEYKKLVSNPELIMKMGWSPKVGIDDLVDLMMGK